MIIEAGRLPPGGERLTGEEPPELLDIGGDAVVAELGSICYDVTAQLIEEALYVSGTVAVDAEFLCSRCAVYFKRRVAEETFHAVHPVSPENQSVDLTEDVREAILLVLPAHPVCRSTCKGVCPRCGANRNMGACNCQRETDVRWGSLDDLQFKDEAE